MSNNKDKKPTKTPKEPKVKAEKLTRAERKEQSAQLKVERAAAMFQKRKAKEPPIKIGSVKEPTAVNEAPTAEKPKKSFFSRKGEKKDKDRINWKLAFREFPVKMAKEVSRIRWARKGSLGRKFLITILFIIAFAVFFFCLDEILSHVLKVAHII
ncbi:preprotein translocase subunit SecE [Spiroplasma eriocheiris]|uniref:Preprotein translocase subunit SecE n=1 Tax=Spiroplasma eriocheiris TaxID=315358 RepID=A0A0H3XLW1_9MOLU|nr:preprotein translocase subunit SecE [Spiroplasma eriocheiris]AHF57350.1 hypothetical protein SPE_0217 [Spiroplasma eriocheiris CCTCC M 207170]AKM53807.1 hypothetical protein SERIO_v1c02190 [Spiroplasma eriocheiris]